MRTAALPGSRDRPRDRHLQRDAVIGLAGREAIAQRQPGSVDVETIGIQIGDLERRVGALQVPGDWRTDKEGLLHQLGDILLENTHPLQQRLLVGGEGYDTLTESFVVVVGLGTLGVFIGFGLPTHRERVEADAAGARVIAVKRMVPEA